MYYKPNTQPSMSNKQKKGNISEDLAREYVSLNYSYKRAESGIWEQVFKN